MIQEQAKKYYADHAFFDNDRAFAERHFCEGAKWAIEKACEWLRQCTTFVHPDYRHPVPYFSDDDIEEFRKAMEE